MKFLKTVGCRWLWRSVLAAVLLLLIAGVIAPFVNASLFAPHIRWALEASLNRTVRFDAVHLSVFSGLGFSLSDVRIEEDPRFGFETFASVPTLQARLRFDTLLRGHVAFSSLRLVDPSLNLVKRDDGSWNVVELLSRLTSQSSLPIDLFPAFSVSGGRIDIKLGQRKTTLYIADTDLSVYPEHSGKLYVRFSGAPARTDRAANGFGHLRGALNWYRQPATLSANQLEADITLDASNLGEISTLFQGQDEGIHGTIASHARIEGPLNALRVDGNLTLTDVRRWDLMPAESARELTVHYSGNIDSTAQALVLRTDSGNAQHPNPVALQLHVSNFLRQPEWSVLASLSGAPTSDLLPIGRRMGLPLPPDFKLEGTVEGAIGYSEAAGFAGSIQLRNLSAGLPNLPALRTDSLVARISNRGVQFQPSEIQTDSSGSMLLGGEYDSSARRVSVSIQPVDFSVAELRGAIGDWFGTPAAMDALQSGTVTGKLKFEHSGDDPPQWSGQCNFRDAEIQAAGLPDRLRNSRGQLRFGTASVDVDHASGEFGSAVVSLAYHANGPRAIERLRMNVDAADFHDVEAALAPAMRAQGVFERLGVAPRKVPAWLAARHLQGDITIQHFSVNGLPMGLHTKFLWNGTKIQFTSLALTMAEGDMYAGGTLDMTAGTPHYRLTGSLTGLRWRGGILNADGTLQTSGLGADVIQHMHAEGAFKGEDVALSADDAFSEVSGEFDLSFADGWPDLKIQQLEASESDEVWTGIASTRDDGRLIVDLEHEGRQRRVVSALQMAPPALSSLERSQ